MGKSVYVVLGVMGGVPSDVFVTANPKLAADEIAEMARSLGIDLPVNRGQLEADPTGHWESGDGDDDLFCWKKTVRGD